MRYLISCLNVSAMFFLFSCTSNEIGNSKDVNPDAVYFDYKVWSEEGNRDAVVKLQFRMGGPNGTTLVLNQPGKVELDGEEIAVDSTNFDGAYYEVLKPLKSFSGKHSIVFTALNKKEYREDFEFVPFTLDPDVPEIMQRGDLVFSFRGLKDVDYLRVWMSDTLFSSGDINDIDTVENGRLVISRERMKNLANGPINLQFHKETDRPLEDGTSEGGRLYMTYGLKRVFELKDAPGH